MTSLAWFSAGFGVCFALVLVVAIAVDILFVEHGIPTISHRCLSVGRRYPIVPALIAGIVCLVVGILFGHLWFYQVVVE